MRYQFEPLDGWEKPVTQDHPTCRFGSGYDKTLSLLERETEKLGADLIVIQIDVTRSEIRNDGLPRSSARPRTSAVRISFKSVRGPLSFATDRYADWRDNLRAIAMSLEALRAVDRYGVNETGEQYTGWLQLEAPKPDLIAARALLDSYGGLRAALKATHPDIPGADHAAYPAVEAAKTLLEEKGIIHANAR